MILRRVTLDEFKSIAEEAHMVCFNQLRPREKNTFDFALVVEDEDGTPLSYATCINFDTESVYMQHGGAFPSAAKSAKTVRSYHTMINHLRESYSRASTVINAQNISMIKLAWSAGFQIHGADVMTDGVWLHLLNELRRRDGRISR